MPWTTVFAFLISQNSVSTVKEVTGVASNAFAPATLAGRGVIKLIGADAGIFPRVWGIAPIRESDRLVEFMATVEPQGPRWGVWQCPLALLFGKSWTPTQQSR